ncbi:MAG: type II toxin-antitoxin system VapC family toxin [Deltaproteobacteria bacterium]|nr:type II toxin-antitoxin system VapC family toxin [Deltaproteobacteria bacterium]
MRLLLDTHAFLWWLAGDPKLSAKEVGMIAAPSSLVYISAVSLWEISIKAQLGRLDVPVESLEEEISANDFSELAMSARHAVAAGQLPRHHDDPFDRMLIAQARLEGLTLVSHDRRFPDYGVSLLS